ncbi:MAG: DUF6371 domain-containing protein [Ginsengibacter sp.]
MTISENTIQQIRNTNLIDIIGKYVKLKKAGSRYVGLCPFHNEKTPSFYVQPGKGFYCFGCDAKGGNAIDFVMKYESKDFPNAVIHVASMNGVMIEDGITPFKPKIKPLQTIALQMMDYIPHEKVSLNLAAYKANNLFIFFSSLFGEHVARYVCEKYAIGSSKYFGPGTTGFIQKDIRGNIRQVKVILYDATTGRRSKEKQFEPKIIGRDLVGYDKNLIQCFFGEPLIKNNSLPISLVESEKSAAICSICYPQFVWLATGGKNGCNMTNPAVNHVLKNREIHLFPDVDAVEDWRKAANELKEQGFTVFLNDVMAKDAKPGSKDDIADLILLNRSDNQILLNEYDYPVTWDYPAFGYYDKWHLLNHLINEGSHDTILNLSGKITDAEFMERQKAIEAKLTNAGIDLMEYVNAFKKN